MPGEHIISIYKMKKLLNNDDGPILNSQLLRSRFIKSLYSIYLFYNNFLIY